MRWAEHVARMGQMTNAYTCFFFSGKPDRKRPLGRLRVDEWIILEWILRKQGERLGLDSSDSG